MSSNLKFGRSIMVCFSFCSMTFKQMSNNTWYVSRDFFGESRQYGEIAYEEISYVAHKLSFFYILFDMKR